MTNEERDKAIRILQWLHDNKFLFRSTEEDVKYATKLAMQALLQEPSGDLISRQAALDCFTATKLKKFDFILYAREEIKKLPSVKPQESSITWMTGADGAKIAFLDVPIPKVLKICEILQEPTITSTEDNAEMIYPQVEGITPTVVKPVPDCGKGVDSISEIPNKCFDGVTNGEVIRTLFPNLYSYDGEDYVLLDLSGFCGGKIEKKWWDEPYQKGGKE